MPSNVQTADAEQIEKLQPLDLTDFLNRQFASVSINHAQNNPLQPDVNFRGFTASPLLGLAPGLAVYQNGVRINEPFGDTVNWDLLPVSAIGSVQLLAGTNPVFGLNTLGGALSRADEERLHLRRHGRGDLRGLVRAARCFAAERRQQRHAGAGTATSTTSKKTAGATSRPPTPLRFFGALS